MMDTSVRTQPIRVEGYRILKELGRGATARVYSAVQESSQTPVALKVFHAGLSGSEEFRSRMNSETKAMRSLNHPNIVRILDSLIQSEPPALAFELVEGVSLGEFQKRLPYLLPEISVLVLIEILKALESAHQAGIVHRDLKPSNILVSDQGQIFVTDFGLAKIRDATVATMSGALLGSPDYMSPEQATGDITTERSDLFSVTSILYFLMTGTHPFSCEAPLATLAAVGRVSYEAVGKRNPKVSWELSRILDRGFAKNPSERFSNASEYRKVLEHYLSGIGLVPDRLSLKDFVGLCYFHHERSQQRLASQKSLPDQKESDRPRPQKSRPDDPEADGMLL